MKLIMENWKGYLAEADELPPGFRAKMAELFFNYKFPKASAEFEKAKTKLESLPPDVDPTLREKARKDLYDIPLRLKREASEGLKKLIADLPPELRGKAKQALDDMTFDLEQKATTPGPEQPVLGPGDIEI
jgi:hypothetical protein